MINRNIKYDWAKKDKNKKKNNKNKDKNNDL